MTTSVQGAPAGGQTQPHKKAKINRWDSPWLNSKFIIGLCMVFAIPLMGLIGQFFGIQP